MKKWAVRIGLGIASTGLVFANCNCNTLPPDVTPLAASADELSASIEEFGTASMSAPILTPPSATFNFKLTGVNATTFYNDAKSSIQTRVGQFSQAATIAGLGVQGTFTPATGTTTTANTSTNSTNTSTSSSSSNTSSPTAPNPSDAANLNNGTFQSLINSAGGTALSDRDALFQAAGDNATAAIFQVLGDQSLVAKFSDKQVVLGVVTVAVNPGWRTQRGYAADISTQTGYKFAPARLDVVKKFTNDPNVDVGIRKRVAMTYGLALPSGNGDPFDPRRPIPPEYAVPSDELLKTWGCQVSAVAPMTESTVNSDQNSRRSQTQLALDLAGALSKAGLAVQATFFDHFAKSLQQDINSTDLTTTVNTYTVNGGLFGFQIGPKLRAIANASQIDSKPTDVLDRQAFPALIIFGFDSDETRPRVKFDDFGQLRVYEPKIHLTTLTSWEPLHGPYYGRYPRVSAQERLGRVQRFLQAQQRVDEATEQSSAEEVKDDVDQLLEELSLLNLVPNNDRPATKPAPYTAPSRRNNRFALINSAVGTITLPSADLSHDLQSRLTRLDGSLKAKIHALRDDPSAKPLYHELISYEHYVSDRIVLSGLPQSSRGTAIAYLLDITTNQLTSLNDTVAKAAPAPPANSDGSGGGTPTKGGSNGNSGIDDRKAEVAKAVADLSSAIQAQIDILRALDDPNSTAETQSSFDCINSDLIAVNTKIDTLNKALAASPGDNPPAPKVTSNPPTWLQCIFGTAKQQPVTPAPNKPPANDDSMSCFKEICSAIAQRIAPAPKQPPKPASSAPKLSDTKASEVKALLACRDEVQAAEMLCEAADKLETKMEDRERFLQQGASSIQAALFSPEEDSVHRRQFTFLGHSKSSDRNDPHGVRPSDDNTEGYALAYSRELLFKAFGAIYDAPLPESLVQPPAVKTPTISGLFTNFVPSAAKPFPAPSDVITVTIVGSNLDQIDQSTPAMPLEINSSGTNPTAVDPVTIQDFAATANAVTVHISINPTYHLPLALQFTLANSAGVLNTAPFAVARLDDVDLSKSTVIRRITGSVTDPTQQQKDELEIIHAPANVVTPDVLKAKVEENKPETRRNIDVNVDFAHHPANGQ